MESWELAERALRGVGDATLGEWRERPARIVHLRRRLTDAERLAFASPALTVRDIRGTPEELERMVLLLEDAPVLLRHFAPRLEALLA
jgi:hypothetical protein